MGKLKLIQGAWDGKVGEFVGAKWKDKKTVRSFTKPSNPNTANQQKVRSGFTAITSFVAMFADGIKYLTALNIAGMSVRNAIIKLNKEMVAENSFDAMQLLISKGGLQKPQGVTVSLDSNKAKVGWTRPTATNFTENAQMVIVAVDVENEVTDVFTAAADTPTAVGTVEFATGATPYIYCYYLDKRGSNKVASVSVCNQVV